MSLYPAATFSNFNTYGPKMIPAAWGSPLYVIHKDITKTLEAPNSINEIINGNETEAQYSVILKVPGGARGFLPFWIINGTFSASTAWPAEFKVTVTVASGTDPLRWYFMGRVPSTTSDYTYNPFSISMTSAPDPGTIGYWHPLGAVRMSTSTVGSDNFIGYGNTNASAAASGYALPVAASNGLTRTYVVPTHLNRAGSTGLENLIGLTSYPNSGAPANFAGDAGMVPLFGCDRLTCFGTHTSTAPTIAVGANMGSGTISNISIGLGVRFVA